MKIAYDQIQITHIFYRYAHVSAKIFSYSAAPQQDKSGPKSKKVGIH